LCRSPHEAQTSISQTEELLRQAKLYFKKVEPQTRQLDKNRKDQYKLVESRLNRELTAQLKALATLKKEKPELFLGMNEAKRAEHMEQRTRLLQGREIANSTSDSLRRTQRTVHDSIAVGEETSVILEVQTEKMEGMRDSLYDTDNMLDKSRAVLRRMNTRVVTNKLVTGLIILLEIAIAALIIYIKFYT
jgi:vesicle transport through interaction with t-SNAREs protein 1